MAKPKTTPGVKKEKTTTAPKVTAREMLATYGKVISKPELKSFQEAGFTPARAVAFAENRPNVNLNRSAAAFAAKAAAPTTATTPTDTTSDTKTDLFVPPSNQNVYSSEDMMAFLEQEAVREQTLAGIDSNTRITLGNLDADARKESARLAADAQIRSTGISADATRYVSDREKEAILQRAEIESKGRLDLQAIINAGMKNVAEIEGLTARDVATIGGKYGVEQEQARQTGQRDIARIAGRSGILQGLVGAFNF